MKSRTFRPSMRIATVDAIAREISLHAVYGLYSPSLVAVYMYCGTNASLSQKRTGAVYAEHKLQNRK